MWLFRKIKADSSNCLLAVTAVYLDKVCDENNQYIVYKLVVWRTLFFDYESDYDYVLSRLWARITEDLCDMEVCVSILIRTKV